MACISVLEATYKKLPVPHRHRDSLFVHIIEELGRNINPYSKQLDPEPISPVALGHWMDVLQPVLTSSGDAWEEYFTESIDRVLESVAAAVEGLLIPGGDGAAAHEPLELESLNLTLGLLSLLSDRQYSKSLPGSRVLYTSSGSLPEKNIILGYSADGAFGDRAEIAEEQIVDEAVHTEKVLVRDLTARGRSHGSQHQASKILARYMDRLVPMLLKIISSGTEIPSDNDDDGSAVAETVEELSARKSMDLYLALIKELAVTGLVSCLSYADAMSKCKDPESASPRSPRSPSDDRESRMAYFQAMATVWPSLLRECAAVNISQSTPLGAVQHSSEELVLTLLRVLNDGPKLLAPLPSRLIVSPRSPRSKLPLSDATVPVPELDPIMLLPFAHPGSWTGCGGNVAGIAGGRGGGNCGRGCASCGSGTHWSCCGSQDEASTHCPSGISYEQSEWNSQAFFEGTNEVRTKISDMAGVRFVSAVDATAHSADTASLSSAVLERVPATALQLTANHDVNGGGTGKEFVRNLANDGTEGWNKWYSGSPTLPIVVEQQFLAPHESMCIGEYKVCSANDAPERDPTAWRIFGQVSSTNSWTLMHTVKSGDVDFSQRWQWHTFSIPVEFQSVRISAIRMEITAVRTVGASAQLGHWHLMRIVEPALKLGRNQINRLFSHLVSRLDQASSTTGSDEPLVALDSDSSLAVADLPKEFVGSLVSLTPPQLFVISDTDPAAATTVQPIAGGAAGGARGSATTASATAASKLSGWELAVQEASASPAVIRTHPETALIESLRSNTSAKLYELLCEIFRTWPAELPLLASPTQGSGRDQYSLGIIYVLMKVAGLDDIKLTKTPASSPLLEAILSSAAMAPSHAPLVDDSAVSSPALGGGSVMPLRLTGLSQALMQIAAGVFDEIHSSVTEVGDLLKYVDAPSAATTSVLLEGEVVTLNDSMVAVSSGSSSKSNLVNATSSNVWESSSSSKPHWIEISVPDGTVWTELALLIHNHGSYAPESVRVKCGTTVIKEEMKLHQRSGEWVTLLSRAEAIAVSQAAGDSKKLRVEIIKNFEGGINSKVTAIRLKGASEEAFAAAAAAIKPPMKSLSQGSITASFQAGATKSYKVIWAGKLNIRKSVALDSEIVCVAKAGDVIVVDQATVDSAGVTRLHLLDGRGWTSLASATNAEHIYLEEMVDPTEEMLVGYTKPSLAFALRLLGILLDVKHGAVLFQSPLHASRLLRGLARTLRTVPCLPSVVAQTSLGLAAKAVAYTKALVGSDVSLLPGSVMEGLHMIGTEVISLMRKSSLQLSKVHGGAAPSELYQELCQSSIEASKLLGIALFEKDGSEKFTAVDFVVESSSHPYRDNADEYTVVAVAGAKGYTVSFDPRSALDSGCEYVSFYKDDTKSANWGEKTYVSGKFPGMGGVPPLVIPAAQFITHFHSADKVRRDAFALAGADIIVGSLVKVKAVTRAEAEAAQSGHGGWASSMEGQLGKYGTVLTVTGNKISVKVVGGSSSYTWNRALLELVSSRTPGVGDVVERNPDHW